MLCKVDKKSADDQEEKGESSKAKDNSIAKSARTTTRRFRQCLWSYIRWKLTDEDAKTLILTGIEFNAVTTTRWKDRPHVWVAVLRRHLTGSTLVVEPPDANGVVTVRKQHVNGAKYSLIGFGFGTWKDIFVAVDPHLLPPAKGRVKPFDGDLLVSVREGVFVELVQVYGSARVDAESDDE